jgi:Putative stress-induced transcription regulator
MPSARLTGYAIGTFLPDLQFLIAGSLAFDFLNSIAIPRFDTPIDWLDNGDGLLKWLAQAKLVPAGALDELKARAMRGELDKVAD